MVWKFESTHLSAIETGWWANAQCKEIQMTNWLSRPLCVCVSGVDVDCRCWNKKQLFNQVFFQMKSWIEDCRWLYRIRTQTSLLILINRLTWLPAPANSFYFQNAFVFCRVISFSYSFLSKYSVYSIQSIFTL